MLQKIRIILVSPTHPGNIGSAARAMKTMGLSELVLVNPCENFPSQTATAMAAGADDILANAQIVSSLDEALAECQMIIGTSARLRQLPVELLSAEQCGPFVVQQAAHSKVALMFGREHAGLTNEELNRCHYHVHIPSNPDFSSLNLGAAVQVLSYSVRMAYLATQETPVESSEEFEPLASDEQMQIFYNRLEQLLLERDFIKRSSPKKIMARLRRLFNRAQVEQTEIDLLLGVLRAVGGERGE
jgi:tRNA (cytidine32/uridine32-2'-O)-methyltransferase